MHIETGRHLYGGARQVLYLLRGLKEHGVDSVLVCPEGSAIESAAGDVARVCALPWGGDLDLAGVPRVRRLIRSESPDIVHLHSRRGADTLGALAAIATRTRVVLSRRVDNPESAVALALKYRLYDHVITISEAIARVLSEQGVTQDRLTCVPSAVDMTEWATPATRSELCAEFSLLESQKLVGMAAQFIPRKGHDTLIDALRRLVDPLPEVHVLLFGKGPQQEVVQKRVESEGLAQHVTFAGYRDDLPRWLGALDLVGHPARREGLGVALLQAAAAGVAIVAADAGGIPEIVRPGETGWLVPPDRAEDLAEAILEALAHPDLREARATAAREHVRKRFSIDAMTRGNLAIYQRLLGVQGQ
ncbi:MAG: glycosyltransferase [Pseudomonadota bacterium]